MFHTNNFKSWIERNTTEIFFFSQNVAHKLKWFQFMEKVASLDYLSQIES